MQTCVLPQVTLLNIRSIAYRFICNGQRKVAWSIITKLRSQGGTLQWKGSGMHPSMANAMAIQQEQDPMDVFAKGIWSAVTRQMSLHLWRVRWKNLPTKDKSIRRGIAISEECLLCGEELETTDHVFLNCVYARWILKEGFDVVEGRGVNQAG